MNKPTLESKKGETVKVQKKVNLFDNAPEKSKGKARDISKKDTVVIKDDHLNEDAARFVELNKKIDSLKAEQTILHGQIRDLGKDKMIDKMTKEKKFNGSFNIEIQGKENDKSDPVSFMFITTDRYISIDEERAIELIKKYGEKIVTKDSTFTFNNSMLEEYGQILSDMIMNSDEIADDDKGRMIEEVTKYSVTKGTIKEVPTKYGKGKKARIEEVIEEIKPVFQVKGIDIKR